MTDHDDYLEGRDRESRLPAAGSDAVPSSPMTPILHLMNVEALPPSFDDAEGEWRTILTKNDPFAVLFLDARNWRSVTVEMVKSRREVLTEFWKQKIVAMRSGARTQILKKYGGPDRSEYLVESFPHMLNAAYEELSTEERIRTVGAKLERLRLEAGLDEVKRQLEFFLIDGELTPLEARSLFVEAARIGLEEEVVAQFITVQLDRRGLHPTARPHGRTSKEQICSVSWSTSQANGGRGVRRIAFASAIIIALLTLLFVAWSHKPHPAPARSPATKPPEPGLIAAKNASQNAAVAEHAAPMSIAVPASQPPAAPPKSETDTQAEREAIVAEMQRKSENESRDAAQAAHDEIERSLPALRELAAQDRFDQVETESERLMTLAAKHSLTEDIVAIREVASAARERKMNEVVEQERRARYVAIASQIRQLTEAGKYPEAISLSNETLKDPQLPPDLREQIIESLEKAKTELKRIMSSAIVKGGDVKPMKKH
jgi:hypothetical protein